jgi:hypothetical protein
MGIPTACRAWWTSRTAIGRMAGPERPPTTFASRGRRVSTSMAIAGMVLMSEMAEAPAASTARATTPISVTFGVSFGITGRRVLARTASVTEAAISGSQPKRIPPSCTLGQEMFISIPDTPSTSSRMPASSAYSSRELPQMLTRMAMPSSRSRGIFSSMKRSIPTSWRPMALSMPDGVSQIRGGAAPSRGARYSPLTAMPPIAP